MMKKISFYAVFVALALFVAVPLAHATTITELQAMIATLNTKTTNVIISGKQAEKDRAGLLEKVTEASLKVDQAKFCDAVVKINDFQKQSQRSHRLRQNQSGSRRSERPARNSWLTPTR